MNKLKLSILAIFALASVLVTASPYFAKHPTLTPDAQKIIFSYAGDLWIVASGGGTATRLTAMDGEENNPRVSPDGKWLAFSSRQAGGADVYVMPLKGGTARQLTFHSGNDLVDSWDWDNKTIYFNSSRYNYFSTYKVSRDGGTPVRLFNHFFNTIHDVVINPVNNDIYFSDTWESFYYANRKRYKGAYNPDIKSYNPRTKKMTVHTDYEGKDFQPAFDRNGNLFFISDEANGEYNLYRFLDGKKTQLTNYKNSIFNIQISTSGEKLVFEKDYSIYLYDVKINKANKVEINLYDSNYISTEQDYNITGKITNFAVSHDNKKIAFASRGELFISDIKGKFIKKVDSDKMGRVMEVEWLPDNKTVLFTQTVDGWQNLFTIDIQKGEKEKQITLDKQNNRNLSLSNNLEKAAYLSGRNELRLLDLKTFKSETIAKDEIWAMYNPVPRFSPDDKYLTFTPIKHFEREICIVNLETKKITNITNSGVTESDPFWSPDAKYLYFSSDRYNPVYPYGDNSPRIYRIHLNKIDSEYRTVEFTKLFKPENSDKKDDKSKDNNKKITDKIITTIDFKDLEKRWELVSPRSGKQNSPYVYIKKDKTYVLFLSDHGGGTRNIWKVTYEPFEKPKTEEIKNTKTNNLYIRKSKDNHYILLNGMIQTLDITSGAIKQISMKHTFTRNLKDEFTQMFYETWANMQENFYNENFHGVNWENMKTKYGRYLPYLQTRGDIRLLISDMLGELNSSHQRFTSRGDEEETYYKFSTVESGIIWDEKAPYIIKSILDNSAIDKQGNDLQTGDKLIAIDGKKLTQVENRFRYFTFPARPDELTLTFKRGEKKFDILIHPENVRGFRNRLYDDWIETNQKRVDEKSKKKIAYIHMKDMMPQSLRSFIIEMTTEWYNRDALILDLRYNTGGNVHDGVLNFLSQRPYTKWKYRGGKFAPQPNFAPAAKPIILLINEQSLSDAEMTAAGFKELKMGKIIGTETYRWLIFTSGKALVDGSFYRLPGWGCYFLDGRNIEEHGVKPDIYIKNSLVDRLEGNDPQLDRAIYQIMKEFK